MMEYELAYNYTPHHRYDSDLDEKVEAMVEAALKIFGGEITGSWGGTGFSSDPDAIVADNGFSFTAPDLERADEVRKAADTILKFYDDRYGARLSWLADDDEDDDA